MTYAIVKSPPSIYNARDAVTALATLLFLEKVAREREALLGDAGHGEGLEGDFECGFHDGVSCLSHGLAHA